jgi:hypothetical protein
MTMSASTTPYRVKLATPVSRIKVGDLRHDGEHYNQDDDERKNKYPL